MGPLKRVEKDLGLNPLQPHKLFPADFGHHRHLTLIFFPLETTFSPHMLLTHLISMSVQCCDYKTALQSGQGGGPPGTNHDCFKANPSSHHVHSTLRVTTPTSPRPTFHLTQNQRARAQMIT